MFFSKIWRHLLHWPIFAIFASSDMEIRNEIKSADWGAFQSLFFNLTLHGSNTLYVTTSIAMKVSIIVPLPSWLNINTHWSSMHPYWCWKLDQSKKTNTRIPYYSIFMWSLPISQKHCVWRPPVPDNSRISDLDHILHHHHQCGRNQRTWRPSTGTRVFQTPRNTILFPRRVRLGISKPFTHECKHHVDPWKTVWQDCCEGHQALMESHPLFLKYPISFCLEIPKLDSFPKMVSGLLNSNHSKIFWLSGD